MTVDEQTNVYEVTSSRDLQQAWEAHYSADNDATARYEMVWAISSAFVFALHDVADAIRHGGRAIAGED